MHQQNNEELRLRQGSLESSLVSVEGFSCRAFFNSPLQPLANPLYLGFKKRPLKGLLASNLSVPQIKHSLSPFLTSNNPGKPHLSPRTLPVIYL